MVPNNGSRTCALVGFNNHLSKNNNFIQHVEGSCGYLAEIE